MCKTLVAVYKKISADITVSIEDAFYKTVMSVISCCNECTSHGIIFDLPDAPCYRSHCDGKIEREIRRCYSSIPKRYTDALFVAIRPRRYSLKHTNKDAFSCENGEKGAITELLQGKKEYIFLLGDLPSSFSYVYFSASEGMLEAGGLNALIIAAEKYQKNVFPSLKISKRHYELSIAKSESNVFSEKIATEMSKFKNPSLKGGRDFSAYEGLYIKNNNVSFTDKRLNRQKNALLLKDISVYSVPKLRILSKLPNIERKTEDSRFAYRAALASSRIFLSAVTNPQRLTCASDVILTLTALLPMRLFGFLGVFETVEASDELFDLLEQTVYEDDIKEQCGKLFFLLTVLQKAYTLFAKEDSRFWCLRLRASLLSEFLTSIISNNIALCYDIYLILCYFDIRTHITQKITSTPLISAMLSETTNKLCRFACEDLSKSSTALNALISATNICFDGLFKNVLQSCPIFTARSSILIRQTLTESETTMLSPSVLTAFPKPSFGRVLLNSPGLSPVQARFCESGTPVSLLPYAAYIEQIIRHFSTDNHIAKDILCFSVNKITPTLLNFIKVSKLFQSLEIIIHPENCHSFTRAAQFLRSGEKISLIRDGEEYEKISSAALFSKRLSAFTTLTDLTSDMRKNFKDTL